MRRSIDASSMFSNDDLAEYDIISDGHKSLESSIADLALQDSSFGEDAAAKAATMREPEPAQSAAERFGTPMLTAEDIQAYVRATAGIDSTREPTQKVIRVYVDGVFDPFNAGHALQLRQAKLSFPSVHLLVGVFSDDLCQQHGTLTTTPHIERCEMIRHCRWVDEVVPDAPWKLDEDFLSARRIDYVAIDEGTSVDPAYEKERVKGYDLAKSLRKAIPTRRTMGLSVPQAAPPRKQPTPVIPESRNGTVRKLPAPPVPGVVHKPKEVDSEEASPFQEPLVDLFD